MTDEPSPKENPAPTSPEPTDAPSRGDYLALGIGCLVTLILLVAVVLVGMSRG